MNRHQDHIKARYKREENVADTNCTPEDKQPVIYEGDVGEPAAHAQEKQKETHQQTEEQRGDSQGKEGEQVSAQTPVQTDNQTEGGNPSEGRQRISAQTNGYY